MKAIKREEVNFLIQSRIIYILRFYDVINTYVILRFIWHLVHSYFHIQFCYIKEKEIQYEGKDKENFFITPDILK